MLRLFGSVIPKQRLFDIIDNNGSIRPFFGNQLTYKSIKTGYDIGLPGYRSPHYKRVAHPAIMDDLFKLLKANGHSCMSIIGTSNHRFEWCQKDICPEINIHLDMNRRNQEAEDFVRKLRAEGHKCIQIKESYPIQIGWCQQSKCTHT